jgi:hypothetical protein
MRRQHLFTEQLGFVEQLGPASRPPRPTR